MDSDETTTSRWKKILIVAWPLILANSFWNLQLTIDRIFLGTLSTEALGAAMAVMGVFRTESYFNLVFSKGCWSVAFNSKI